jgi:predicted RNA methylase
MPSETDLLDDFDLSAALHMLRPSEYTAALIQTLLGLPRLVRGANVLEIGSGSGVVLAALASLGAASICGIDSEAQAILAGEAMLEAVHGGVPPWRSLAAGQRAAVQPRCFQPAAISDGQSSLSRPPAELEPWRP